MTAAFENCSCALDHPPSAKYVSPRVECRPDQRVIAEVRLDPRGGLVDHLDDLGVDPVCGRRRAREHGAQELVDGLGLRLGRFGLL